MSDKTRRELAEMAARICGCDADEFEQGMREHAERNQLGIMLEDMRVDKGWSQNKMAKLMGYSLYRLSRMEASADADLRFGDILACLKVFGMEMSITLKSSEFPEGRTVHYSPEKQYDLRVLMKPQKHKKYPLPQAPQKLCVAETPAEYKTKPPKRALKKARA